ncbi:MAG: prepilin-type N-terminal cleavage/methylation domain-containing protein [Patescibacteria group bacterium]
MNYFRAETNRGFTLIEILIVIGIIAVLAAIVIVAINPAKQFAQARNTQRTSNVNAILNAIGQRIADNKGVFAGTFSIGGTTYDCGQIPTATTSITSRMASSTSDTTGDMGCLAPTYLPQLPIDPAETSSADDTGYEVQLNNSGRVTICAPNAASENSIPDPEPICVTR